MTEVFGMLAVSAMAFCYALEERGAVYSWGFGAACLASSGYAVVIGSWPFAVIEVLWAGLAFRKGLLRTRAPVTP